MDTIEHELAYLYTRAQQAETRAETKEILRQAEILRNKALHIHNINKPSNQ
jgi:hypothetical protein